MDLHAHNRSLLPAEGLASAGTPDAGAVALQASVDTLEASATAIEADTQDIQSRLPAALVGGRIDATVDATGMESGAIDAILDDTVGDGTLTVRQVLRVLVAGMAGKLSGAATTTMSVTAGCRLKASIDQSITRRPSSGCHCLGASAPARRPLPPATIRTATRVMVCF